MKQTFLFSLICLVVASGCKKDRERESLSNTTKYLQRYMTTTDGVSSTYTLLYDDKNRLVAYNSEEDNYHSKVTYDGNDNPIKFELESEGAKQVFEITYSNTGIPLSATSVLTYPANPELEFETAVAYETANGKVSTMRFSNESGEESIYTLSYTGKNLTRVALTSDNSELQLTWKYGNKKSPFSAARFDYLVIPDLFGVFSSENEIIESKLDITGLGSFISTYAYQYAATGYPSSAVEKDEDGKESRTTYLYK
ncbi:hypothetical protein GCM10007415_11800 [Parapedobacter pyrenivorans]|uniref:Uncharacterized protein n=1 Tax=Parapedobacter pyrenivorans TaxID=1305674 RepID=A0A917M6Q3_9SPHI|nr:hypothetical protein [Parapedobacter pyrenivorans]GGG80911.1 hypothetical protein GCM10007415_11800 [Parapedobacter pyrenivorans]